MAVRQRKARFCGLFLLERALECERFTSSSFSRLSLWELSWRPSSRVLSWLPFWPELSLRPSWQAPSWLPSWPPSLQHFWQLSLPLFWSPSWLLFSQGLSWRPFSREPFWLLFSRELSWLPSWPGLGRRFHGGFRLDRRHFRDLGRGPGCPWAWRRASWQPS